MRIAEDFIRCSCGHAYFTEQRAVLLRDTSTKQDPQVHTTKMTFICQKCHTVYGEARHVHE